MQISSTANTQYISSIEKSKDKSLLGTFPLNNEKKETSNIPQGDTSPLMLAIRDYSNTFGMAFKNNTRAMELLEKSVEGMDESSKFSFIFAISHVGIVDEVRALEKYMDSPNREVLVKNEVNLLSPRLQDNNVFANELANLFTDENKGTDIETKRLLKEFHSLYTSSFKPLDIKA